jgi:hypothetical protein
VISVDVPLPLTDMARSRSAIRRDCHVAFCGWAEMASRDSDLEYQVSPPRLMIEAITTAVITVITLIQGGCAQPRASTATASAEAGMVVA